MLEHIKSLAPLPASVIRIQELCMMNEIDIKELTQVIESDPMLSANILKAVNSPLYGMSKEISSISQAVMLFGVSMIRGFAAANAIKKTVPIDLTPYGATIDILSETSIMQSALVRAWYSKIDISVVPMLSSAAFLMELGKFLAAQKLIASGESERFHEEIKRGANAVDVEKCYLGMNSYAIASLMFEHWNFEPALVKVLKDVSQESTHPLSQALYVVQTAINLQEDLSGGSIERALEAAKEWGFDIQVLENALKTLQASI